MFRTSGLDVSSMYVSDALHELLYTASADIICANSDDAQVSECRLVLVVGFFQSIRRYLVTILAAGLHDPCMGLYQAKYFSGTV